MNTLKKPAGINRDTELNLEFHFEGICMDQAGESITLRAKEIELKKSTGEPYKPETAREFTMDNSGNVKASEMMMGMATTGAPEIKLITQEEVEANGVAIEKYKASIAKALKTLFEEITLKTPQ